MLGDDDHNDIDNEPINAEDLFGDNLDGDGNENPDTVNNAENEGNENNVTSTDAAQPVRKKYKQINRLANLNDMWLIDSKKENIRKVNSYFENIKFRKGKGNERENLKKILQQFEYYGQQCYPKLCFKDFVEKVEYVSGKRTIRHVLQDIRRGNIELDNDEDDEQQAGDDDEPAVDFGINMNNEDANEQQSGGSPAPCQSPEKQTSPQASPVKPVTMTDEMRDMIRRKREEALAKRKQRLDESVNTSRNDTINEADAEKEANAEDVDKIMDGELSRATNTNDDGREIIKSKDSDNENNGKENDHDDSNIVDSESTKVNEVLKTENGDLTMRNGKEDVTEEMETDE